MVTKTLSPLADESNLRFYPPTSEEGAHFRSFGWWTSSASKEQQERLLEVLLERTLTRILEVAFRAFRESILLVAPRTPEQRANRLHEWRESYRPEFVNKLSQELEREFGDVAQSLGDVNPFPRQAEALTERVWPNVSDELYRFGIRALATRWGARQYLDGVLVGEAESSADAWVCPLHLKQRHAVIGQIALDADGSILTERSTTREAVRELLRAK